MERSMIDEGRAMDDGVRQSASPSLTIDDEDGIADLLEFAELFGDQPLTKNCNDEGETSTPADETNQSIDRPLKFEDLSVDQVDKMIADEMKQLSVKDRQKVYDDLHGVADLPNETPEFVARCELQLEAWLDHLAEDNCAYHRALIMDKNYVTNTNFRLMFLRASSFDAREAAERMLIHMRYKEDLFGAEKLTKDITEEDIGEDYASIEENEFMSMLPSRDRSGRAVIVNHSKACGSIPWRQIVRPAWLVSMMLISDEEVQKRGVVGIAFSSGGESYQPSDETLAHAAGIQMAMPYRVVAKHVCTHDSEQLAEFQKLRFFMDSGLRLRFRCHFGDEMEHQKALRSFGILVPCFSMPCSFESNIVRAVRQNCWWQVLRLYSNIVKRKSNLISDDVSSHAGKISATKKGARVVQAIVEPMPHDVINGRGHARLHKGNVRMLELVEEYLKNYIHSSKSGKTDMVKHVVAVIKEEGGRFLKRIDESVSTLEGSVYVGSVWEEMSDAAARDKVSKVFRRCHANNKALG